MKMLVATQRSQGWRDNDFSWTDDGEPVTLGVVCDGEFAPDGSLDPDGWCGCARAWSGLHTGRGTTTAVVAEVEIPDDGQAADHFTKIEVARRDWLDLADPGDRPYIAAVRAEIEKVLGFAAAHPVGSVLELRGREAVLRPEEANEAAPPSP